MNRIKKLLGKLNKGQSSRVIIYMVSQVILQGIAVIAMPVFTRMLTTEQYGRVAVYTTWSSILALIIGLRVDAKVHFGDDSFSKFCSNAYFVVLTTGLGFFLIAGVFVNGLSSLLHIAPLMVLFLILHSFGAVCTKVQSCIFLITKQAIKDIILSITLSLSACILSVALIVWMEGSEGEARMLGLGLPHVILGTIFCFIGLKNIKNNFDKNMLKCIVTLSTPMIFNSLSNLVLGQSDRIMLSEMMGDDQAGIYSFCYSVATPLTAIWSALGAAWRPDYFEKLKERNGKWIKEHSDNYMFLFTCLTCGYLLVGSEVLKILGARDYWSGITILPFVSLSCYFQFISSFPIDYEVYSKKTKLIGIASTLTALINIGLNVWLIPIYGMLGAAIATLAAYALLFLIHDAVAHRLEGYYYRWSFYLKGILPALLCFGITYALAEHMWIRWGIGLCIAILLVWRILKKRTLL